MSTGLSPVSSHTGVRCFLKTPQVVLFAVHRVSRGRRPLAQQTSAIRNEWYRKILEMRKHFLRILLQEKAIFKHFQGIAKSIFCEKNEHFVARPSRQTYDPARICLHL